MIVFSELPATPGSLEPSEELKVVMRDGRVQIENSTRSFTLEEIGISIGATILLNVEPQTPTRAIEVVFPLIEDVDINVTGPRKIAFMQAVLKGAMAKAMKMRTDETDPTLFADHLEEVAANLEWNMLAAGGKDFQRLHNAAVQIGETAEAGMRVSQLD